ncbi:MAG: transposase [Rhodocyclaceae bacterium]|nr:transposase [Rhodocyclaceae bacterium]
MSEDGKTKSGAGRGAHGAYGLVSRDELIVGHKEDGRAVYRREAKATLVAAATAPQASVARIARDHDLNANQLHRWIRQARSDRTRSRFATQVSAGMERAARARRDADRADRNADTKTATAAPSPTLARLLPVTLMTETTSSATHRATTHQQAAARAGLIIEIGEARIVIDGAVDPATLSTVITCLRDTVQDTVQDTVGDTAYHAVSHTITTAR